MFGTPARSTPCRRVHQAPGGWSRAPAHPGSAKAMVSADVARGWRSTGSETAEGTESDQLVAEALRATRIASDTETAQLFGYLRKLRERK